MKYVVVRDTAKVEKIQAALVSGKQEMFPVITQDRLYMGSISRDALEAFRDKPNATAKEVLADAFLKGKLITQRARQSEPLEDALATMRRNRLQFLPVVDQLDHFVGTIDSDSSADSRLLTW
jgi:CBS domain-containing protein